MIRIFDITGKNGGIVGRAQKTAESALSVADAQDAEIDIYFIDDARMRELNKKTRGKDESTNVLSFPLASTEASGSTFPNPERGTEYRGEVILSPEYIMRKNEDLSHMVAHGVFHLVGYNHKTMREAEAMEALEAEVLRGM